MVLTLRAVPRIYTNAVIGLAAVISRVLLIFMYNLLYLPRLDMSLMPGPEGNLYTYDKGFGAYAAMLSLDHRYNNPVFIVFTDIMVTQLRSVRGQAKIRGVVRQARVVKGEEGKTAQSLSLPRARWHEALVLSTPWRLMRRQQVVNRWRLAYLLLYNSDLRQFRRGRKDDPASLKMLVEARYSEDQGLGQACSTRGHELQEISYTRSLVGMSAV